MLHHLTACFGTLWHGRSSSQGTLEDARGLFGTLEGTEGQLEDPALRELWDTLEVLRKELCTMGVLRDTLRVLGNTLRVPGNI